MGSLSSPHFVVFPFMSKGHTIPLLYLSRLLLRRSIAVTIFTTAKNSSFIRDFLRNEVSIVELPFPTDVEGIPPGIESTDKMSVSQCFFPFLRATVLMREKFEEALETLQPPVSCIVSDFFLWWTAKSAGKFRIPRLAFSGMGNYSTIMSQILGRFKPHAEIKSLNEPFPVPGFPHIKLTLNDFDPVIRGMEVSGRPEMEIRSDINESMVLSYGLIVNSFYELESRFIDYLDEEDDSKCWDIGPLCLAEEETETPKPGYMKWLDEKFSEGESVLYVSFGTQAEVSPEQYLEIAGGLEKSQVSFLWVLRSEELDFLPDFESRTRRRGLIVNEFVDQRKILLHEGVKGFLSHCGWNSVLESISAGVPMVALPLLAEQHLNARFVVEEIRVGLRIMPRDGSMRGDVESAEVEMKVRELMGGGVKAAELAKNAVQLGVDARTAMKAGGSSCQSLDLLIADICAPHPDT